MSLKYVSLLACYQPADSFLFQCKFYWQSQGDFLCVKVDRHARKAKSKKATSCNLEIFRMREKDYPVEVLEFKGMFVLLELVN